MKRKWKVGQLWVDSYGFLHRVVRVRRGLAWIVMERPKCTKALTQGPIPLDWDLVEDLTAGEAARP